jgi:uncharacterized protein CbrC (UPF0167 family)
MVVGAGLLWYTGGMNLPQFKYHPDPLATGSVERSDATCVCCGQKRGFIYTGPVYAEEELYDRICPWCIADGSAQAKLGAEFTDAAGVGGCPWDEVPGEVVAEVAYRTPGFCGWQQERWWTHCGDAAEFLGLAGGKEVEAYGPELIESLRDDAGLTENDEEWNRYYRALDKEGSPTAYVFRCRHCGRLGGYSDCD